MLRLQARIGTKVIDDFGATGRVVGNVFADNGRVFVKWDETVDPSMPVTPVLLERIRPA